MIKEFKRLPFIKKISFLFILTLLITLPIIAFIAQQPKNINSKASEPEPTPTKIIMNITGIAGTGRAGTTTPCGGLNQRCCSSIPSCRTDTEQQLNCYSGFCRIVGTVTISPRPKKVSPTPEIYLDDDVQIIQNGQIPHPTSTPTPTPIVTPTPVSSIWIP